MLQGRVLFNFSNKIFKASHTILPYLKLTMKKRISLCQVLQSVYIYFDESKTTERNTSEYIFYHFMQKEMACEYKNKVDEEIKEWL